MENILQEKLQSGEQPIGTFFSIGNASLAECLGLSGLDYLIIDCEHGPFDVESSLEIIRAAELREITALARVKDSSRISILKMLDIGIRGIVIPNVRSVGEVEKIIEYSNYFPDGQRGVAAARNSGFGHEIAEAGQGNTMQEANRTTLVLPQCETRECLEHIEEIAGINGVSGIYVGPFDLSVALGKPAQFGDPEFVAALGRILKACKEAGKYCFIFSMNEEGAANFFNMGFDSVTVSTDADIFIRAYKDVIANVKKY
jgi:4-hydroxy-2-oxoheptanedioate aldolase